MYIILITDDHQLLTSKRERIMERSTNVDTLCFLAKPTRQGVDMADCTVNMEYLSPISNEHHTELLALSDELYKDRLMYKLPFDTNLTKEAGEVEVTLTFTKLELDEFGNTKPYVRKTSPTTITIVPIAAWSKVERNEYLNVLDMAMLQLEGVRKSMEETAKLYDSRKADTITYNAETNSVELRSNNKVISEAAIPNPDDTTCKCEDTVQQ